MKKRYTPEEIEMFRKDPNVKDVNEKRLRFTLAFRQKMYEAINDNMKCILRNSYLFSLYKAVVIILDDVVILP